MFFLNVSFHTLILHCSLICEMDDKNNLWPLIEPDSCKKEKEEEGVLGLCRIYRILGKYRFKKITCSLEQLISS